MNSIGVTIIVAVGTVFVGMGISLLVFSFSIDLEGLDKNGQEYHFYESLGKNIAQHSWYLIGIGLAILVAGISYYVIRIRRLK